jgi:hypothetical protein
MKDADVFNGFIAKQNYYVLIVFIFGKIWYIKVT